MQRAGDLASQHYNKAPALWVTVKLVFPRIVVPKYCQCCKQTFDDSCKLGQGCFAFMHLSGHDTNTAASGSVGNFANTRAALR